MKPALRTSVTQDEIDRALAVYESRRQEIHTQARLCNERAVAFYGALLGYRKTPGTGAAAFLVYQCELYINEVLP